MRKVIVEVKFKLVLSMDEEADLSQTIEELDSVFFPYRDNVDLLDVTMSSYEVLDSK